MGEKGLQTERNRVEGWGGHRVEGRQMANEREAEDQTEKKAGALGIIGAEMPSYRSHWFPFSAYVGYICISIACNCKHSEWHKKKEQRYERKGSQQRLNYRHSPWEDRLDLHMRPTRCHTWPVRRRVILRPVLIVVEKHIRMRHCWCSLAPHIGG